MGGLENANEIEIVYEGEIPPAPPQSCDTKRGFDSVDYSLLQPMLNKLTGSMSPEGLAAQAQMSRSRLFATQCFTLVALILIFLCLAAYLFVQNDEMQKILLSIISKFRPTSNTTSL